MTIKSVTIPATQASAAQHSQSAGHHTHPSQYHISICSRHDKPTSLYLQLVLLEHSCLLEGLVSLFLAIICHGNGKTTFYLNKSSCFHAFLKYLLAQEQGTYNCYQMNQIH
jgi:hypothetical protein